LHPRSKRLKLQNRAKFGTEMHPMKKFATILVLSLATVVVRAALSSPDLIAQIHFAGVQKISASKESAAFNNEFSSAEALALRKQTADKLSNWLPGWLQKNTGVAVTSGAMKLRPLFDDLQKSEWFLEARRTANGRPQVAIAIKLAADRANLWQANLKPFFPAASFKSTGGWLVFDSGPDAPKLGDRLTQETSKPDGAWLSVDVNWLQLGAWYPQLKLLGLPETRLQVTAADANLHIDGKLFFPENLAMNLEPWRMPTNTVHQPFVSFTAVRGFSGWLKTQPWAQPYLLTPEANQLFIWALPQIPYQTFAAVPVADSMVMLAQAYAWLQPVFNAPKTAGEFFTPFTLGRTNDEITLRGTPFIAPYIRSVHEPAGQFLFAGVFPNTPRSKPLPPELFQRLATKDLVYYHWEITAERWPEVLNLSQLGLVLTSHRQLEGNSVALKWIQKIAPKLGNTVTEITRTGPAEMTFTRKAPGGFTAAELFVLGSWLEAPNFPGFDIKMPPRPKRPLRPHHAPPGSPAPATVRAK
jgi:hypothetical protein